MSAFPFVCSYFALQVLMLQENGAWNILAFFCWFIVLNKSVDRLSKQMMTRKIQSEIELNFKKIEKTDCNFVRFAHFFQKKYPLNAYKTKS